MAKYKLPNRLVHVRWKDAASHGDPGWKTWKQIQKLAPAMVQSVGYVVKETDDYIVLVASICEEDGTSDGEVVVPKAYIVEPIKELTCPPSKSQSS